MRLISYKYQNAVSWGMLRDSRIVDLGSRPSYERTLLGALSSPDIVERIKGEKPEPKEGIDVADVTFLPPVLNSAKIICVGLNYRDHVGEAGRPVAQYPTFFSRWADSHVGHRQALVRPRVSEQFDYEGELAVIIGREGRHIPREDAFSYVAGYSCYNDGSIRDWQSRASQFLPGKNFASSGAFGPWIVTADEIPDVTQLTLVTRLNGTVLQRASLSDLIFDIPFLISYISTFTVLSPGDVVVTGTPSGVGAFRDPKVWMKAGDTVEVEISGIGILTNSVVDEDSELP